MHLVCGDLVAGLGRRGWTREKRERKQKPEDANDFRRKTDSDVGPCDCVRVALPPPTTLSGHVLASTLTKSTVSSLLESLASPSSRACATELHLALPHTHQPNPTQHGSLQGAQEGGFETHAPSPVSSLPSPCPSPASATRRSKIHPESGRVTLDRELTPNRPLPSRQIKKSGHGTANWGALDDEITEGALVLLDARCSVANPLATNQGSRSSRTGRWERGVLRLLISGCPRCVTLPTVPRRRGS